MPKVGVAPLSFLEVDPQIIRESIELRPRCHCACFGWISIFLMNPACIGLVTGDVESISLSRIQALTLMNAPFLGLLTVFWNCRFWGWVELKTAYAPVKEHRANAAEQIQKANLAGKSETGKKHVEKSNNTRDITVGGDS